MLDVAREGLSPTNEDAPEPEMSAGNARYEFASRTRVLDTGGIGAVHRLVRKVGLVDAINRGLCLIRQPKPYLDSDHILNIAFHALAGGRVLDTLDLRRQDRAYLAALGARAIPDPTTAGDYCRRFDEEAVCRLMEIINSVRVKIWRDHPTLTRETARIDVDGTLVGTTGECKEGMDVSYKGTWGYHPLLVSLANTCEPLLIVNRPGNRPSHEGAPQMLDCAIEVCRAAGFKDILLRGDTDFSMTSSLDAWDEQGVRFVFGYDASKPLVQRAEQIGESDYAQIARHADALFSARDREARAKPLRVKEQIVLERKYLNVRLEREDLAEFEHKPTKADRSYRIVVVRKTLVSERGQQSLGTNYRYFFYVTNDRGMTREQVVRESNQRCNQENLIEQLKNGARALHAPVNTLVANWAYMVMTSLAWTLKAWIALKLPVSPRHRERHTSDQQRVLRMDFRTFLENFILVPAQIIRKARQLVFRFLAWRPGLPILFRLLDAL
jgi:hypothetical protein